MAPAIQDYLKPSVIRRIRRLDLKARFVVEGFIAGLHRSPFQGFSVEFSDHRKYEPGDEIRRIDWNVFCRTDKLYTRKYQAETNLTCYLLVDRSASMQIRYGDGFNKSDYAACLAASLAYLMVRQRDAVGLVTFDEGIRSFVTPSSKRQQLVTVLGELAKSNPGKRGTNFEAAFSAIGKLIRRRSVLIVFSDFFGDPAQVAGAMRLLRVRQHDVIIFHLLDRVEVEFPFRDNVRFEDVESDLLLTADPRSIREAYQEAISNFIEEMRLTCLRLRIDYTQLDTSVPFDQGLLRFLARRSRLAR